MKRLVAVLAVVILLFAGCLAAPHTRGAVYAVDLGSSYFKMAAPKFNSSIDIVLNEQSRRKTPMMVGFRKGNRYVAEEAKSMAGRFPTLMLPSVNRLVGVSVDEARRINKELLLDLAPLTENKKRGVAELDYTATDVKQQKPEHRGDVPDVFSPEELFSMIVRYTEEVTTADVGEKATSTLLVVPHFYSDRQREALLQGAEMAGVNVLGITHSLTAAAFQFGISQGGFGNDTVVVAIVDMGATKTEIGVFHFGPHPPVPNGTKSDVRMAESLGIMTTLAVESLPYVGGTSIDLCIAEKILDARLVLARGPKHSILKAPSDAPAATLATRKFSLMRAANSLKEALSVNPSFSVVVEAADADGQEFEVTATRDELTSLCFEVFDDVAAAVATAVDASRAAAKRLFNDSTLEIDIAAVELVGGTTRIPAINAALIKGLAKTFATSPPIGRRLNADEAVALGAGYLAARFNPYLRLKGFAVRDILPCALATRVGLVTQNTIRNDDFQRPLFEYTTDEVAGRGCDWLPCRSSVSVRHASDGVFIGVWSPAGYCLSKTAADGGVLRTIKVSGYEDLAATALNKTKHSLGDVTFTTRFELSLTTSGIFNSSDTVIARASLPKAGKKDKGADSTADGEDDEAATAEPKDAKKKKKKAKKGKRHHYVTLQVPAWTFKGKPLPLTSEDLAASKAAVAAIDRLEANARLAALAKNDLETLVLDLKGDAATTHADVLKTVQDITEWLDKRGNDDDCPASEYEAQRAALSSAIAKSKGLPTDEL